MLYELNEANNYIKYVNGTNVSEDKTYAVPTDTSKGPAFMAVKLENKSVSGFYLYWDEDLTISWYDQPKPEGLVESELATIYRNQQI